MPDEAEVKYPPKTPIICKTEENTIFCIRDALAIDLMNMISSYAKREGISIFEAVPKIAKMSTSEQIREKVTLPEGLILALLPRRLAGRGEAELYVKSGTGTIEHFETKYWDNLIKLAARWGKA